MVTFLIHENSVCDTGPLFIVYDFYRKPLFHGNYLTRREQEVPHLYRWWDELRITQHFLLCTANCCYDIPTSFY